MNKTIIININGIVFHIEEDAYETLRSYMIDIKRHFGKSSDSKEILEDIENRIAEMFNERIQSGRKEVITASDVTEVITQMGSVKDFEEEGDIEQDASTNDTQKEKTQQETFGHQYPEPEYFAKRLMRDSDDKVFGGVCSGLGYYFGLDSKWVRIIFILFFLFAGSGVLLYAVLWMVMPMAETRADRMAMRGEAPNLQNFKKSFEKDMEDFQGNFSETGEQIKNSARSFGGFFVSILNIIGKILAFSALIFVGLTLLGLFIFFIFNILNLMGYENPIYFPPLEFLDGNLAILAAFAGFFGIGIPFLALFFLLLRLLFKMQPLNSFSSLTMFTTWVLSVGTIIFLSITTSQDFKETSTIKVQKDLQKNDLYVLSEKDLRVIDASNDDFIQKKINLGESKEYLRNDIDVFFEPVEPLEKPYIEYHYIAKGRNFKQASHSASEIHYHVEQDGKNLLFDSHFSMSDQALNRDQEVDVRLFLPVGTKVKIMDNILRKIRINDRGYYSDQKFTEWVMKANGLESVSKPDEEETEDQGDE